MAGLLFSSVLSGAAQGFSNATQQNNKTEIDMINRNLDWSIKSLMDERIADRAKTDEAARYTRGKTDEAEKYTRDRTDKKTDTADALVEKRYDTGIATKTAENVAAKLAANQIEAARIVADAKDKADTKVERSQQRQSLQTGVTAIGSQKKALDVEMQTADETRRKQIDTEKAELTKSEYQFNAKIKEISGIKDEVPDIDRLFGDKRKPGLINSGSTGEY